MALFLGALLASCGGGNNNNGSIDSDVVVAWSGTVNVAAHPLVGAQVSIYAASNNHTTSPILLAQAITNAQGQFTVSRISTLPSTGQLVYAVATGSNTAIKLLTSLGAYCSTSTSCTFATQITINELTTVASTFGLAPYITNTSSVSVAGNFQALQNSAATANSLVNPATGALAAPLAALNCSGLRNSLPSNCNAVLKLNTLSNLMASCTTASSATSRACSQWLGLATQTTDTLGVILQTATQPSLRNNGTGVFGAVQPVSVYSPALTTAPTDWSLALTYSGGGLNGPVSLAIDAAGHVWVSNNLQGGSLSEFNPDGSAVSPSTGFAGNGLSGPQGLAVDYNGRVWVTNWAQGSGSTLSIFNSDGTAASGSPIASSTANGIASIAGPIDIALAPSGSMWVANYGNATLTEFSSNLQLQVGPVMGAGLSFPVNVTVDNQGNVWTVNGSNATVSAFTSLGVPVQSGPYQNIGLDDPNGAALTSTGALWIANQVGNTLTLLAGGNTPPSTCPTTPLATNSGCVLSSLSIPAFSSPNSIAIDGAGNLWVNNRFSASLSLLSSSGTLLSPQTGYQTPGMLQTSGIAIDASGNVWVLNEGTNTLTKFIGIAAPVATPKQGQSVPI